MKDVETVSVDVGPLRPLQAHREVLQGETRESAVHCQADGRAQRLIPRRAHLVEGGNLLAASTRRGQQAALGEKNPWRRPPAYVVMLSAVVSLRPRNFLCHSPLTKSRR